MTNTEIIAEYEAKAAQLALDKKWREAAKVLLRVAKADPADINRWLQIIKWQRQAGDKKAAIRTIESGVYLHIELALGGEIALMTALIEIHMEDQCWGEAILVGHTLLRRSPNNHYILELLATALLQANDLEDAEHVLRQLITLSPRDPLHRLRLATLLQLQSRLGESAYEFERILEMFPDLPLVSDVNEALDTLDRLQTQQVLMLAHEQLGFRRFLEHDAEAALESLDFHLSENGFDTLKSMIWDGSFVSDAPFRLH